MLKSTVLISSIVSLFIIDGCNNLPVQSTDFIDSVLTANNIKINEEYPLFISFVSQHDCQACTNVANQFFNDFLEKRINIPNSNIIFFTENTRKIEIKHFFKKTYSFDIDKYKLILSYKIINRLLRKYNLLYEGTCVFVLDSKKELLYYNLPKRINNIDSLSHIINNYH